MKVVCRSHRSQNFVDRCNDPIQKWVRWISKECSWPLNLLLVKQIKHFICHLHPYTMSNTLVPLYPSYYTNKGREMEDSNTSLFLDVHHVQKLRLAAQVASLILQQPQNCHLSLHHHRCSLQTTLKELSTQELPQLAHQTHDKIRRHSSFPEIWSITASTQEVEHVEIIHGGMTRLLWRPTKTWYRRERKGWGWECITLAKYSHKEKSLGHLQITRCLLFWSFLKVKWTNFNWFQLPQEVRELVMKFN